eukprot:scaffold421319_cov58-Attheya_sp.AAC.1
MRKNGLAILYEEWKAKAQNEREVAELAVEEKVEHDNCPANNTTSSSKGMESETIVNMILRQGYKKDYICMDNNANDFTTNSQLKHKWVKTIRVVRMTEDDWPRTSKQYKNRTMANSRQKGLVNALYVLKEQMRSKTLNE